MPSSSWQAADFLFINPLLDGGKADSQLQGGVAEFEKLYVVLSVCGFAASWHRNKVQSLNRDSQQHLARFTVRINPYTTAQNSIVIDT